MAMYTVDASDVHKMTEKAIAELRSIPKRMLEIGKWGAAYERRTHPYTNRTGNLQRSTQAHLTRMGADETWLTIRMDMFYASYVNNLGYSNIDYAVGQVSGFLADMFGSIGSALR